MNESDLSLRHQHQFYKQIQALNASLEQQVQEQTAELQRSLILARVLKQITDEIRSSLNPQTVLQTIVDEVRLLFDTDRVVMYRFDRDWVGEVVVESVIEPWNSVLGRTYQDTCFPKITDSNIAKVACGRSTMSLKQKLPTVTRHCFRQCRCRPI
jgi:light-regulated signal transduction histidine kinase (bacteriophytochrome)